LETYAGIGDGDDLIKYAAAEMTTANQRSKPGAIVQA
jgi:hypothetical protein